VSWSVLASARTMPELIAGFVSTLVDFFAGSPSFIAILRHESLLGSSVMVDALRERTTPILDAVLAAVRARQDAGDVRRDVAARELILASFSMIAHPFADAPIVQEDRHHRRRRHRSLGDPGGQAPARDLPRQSRPASRPLGARSRRRSLPARRHHVPEGDPDRHPARVRGGAPRRPRRPARPPTSSTRATSSSACASATTSTPTCARCAASPTGSCRSSRTAKDIDFVVFRENTEGVYVAWAASSSAAPRRGGHQRGRQHAQGRRADHPRGLRAREGSHGKKRRAHGRQVQRHEARPRALAARFHEVRASTRASSRSTSTSTRSASTWCRTRPVRGRRHQQPLRRHRHRPRRRAPGRPRHGGQRQRARPEPTRVALFEPVHGSAPPLAGKDLANPFAGAAHRRDDAHAPRLAGGRGCASSASSPAPSRKALARSTWAASSARAPPRRGCASASPGSPRPSRACKRSPRATTSRSPRRARCAPGSPRSPRSRGPTSPWRRRRATRPPAAAIEAPAETPQETPATPSATAKKEASAPPMAFTATVLVVGPAYLADALAGEGENAAFDVERTEGHHGRHRSRPRILRRIWCWSTTPCPGRARWSRPSPPIP
jgi:hypothetical protein